MARTELFPVNITPGNVRLTVHAGKHQPHAVMRMPAAVAMEALVADNTTHVEHHRSGLLVVRHPDSAPSQGIPISESDRSWRNPRTTQLGLPPTLAREDLTHYGMGGNLVA